MHLLRSAFLLLLCLSFAQAATPPNVVIIFADDLGYGDIGCYGAKNWATPNIDKLASEGVKFTQFYVAQAVCSASRAALLTGKYSHRIPILGALGPKAKNGMPPSETTLAEVLKSRGYATAVFGKWHLGGTPAFLPMNHGFDEFVGIPYSNDMWPYHPTGTYPDLPLMSGREVIEYNSDQRKFTTLFTEHAVKFIEKNKDKPFFLYVPHPMPHVPLFVSDKFAGKSKGGLYGDVIMEIDWSVGQITGALKKHGLDEKTIVIFSSDNGPWLSYGNHGGTKGNLREGKGTVFEGGVRVPFIISWPGELPKGEIREQPVASIDVLPTIAKFAGTEAPPKIDGLDISAVLKSSKAKSPHKELLYFWGRDLQAVRVGDWKMHLPHNYGTPEPAGGDGKPGKIVIKQQPVALYNLAKDPSEKNNLAHKYPDILERMQQIAKRAESQKRN